MIVSNRGYPFGTKVAIIQTPLFSCIISTAKEGVFEKQSTCFSDTTSGKKRVVGKLIYTPALSSDDRLKFHDIIVNAVEQAEFISLGESIDVVAYSLKQKGVITEAINLLAPEDKSGYF